MNSNNPHINNYDLKKLAKKTPELKDFMFVNDYGTETIDFSKAEAVKTLNKALLRSHYAVKHWDFPDAHLCPPIPSRVDYLFELNDVLTASNLGQNAKILDIGTGATCIYSLLGQAQFGWSFIASDADKKAIEVAKKIVDKNDLSEKIKIRFQANPQHILQHILKDDEKITASVCNPPFYTTEEEAIKATQKKWRGLKKEENQRNFSGKANELWYKGGEKAFIQNYIYDSHLVKTQCAWFTTLVSNKDLLRPLKVVLKNYDPKQVKVIKMTLGKKVSHMLLWTYLSEDELNTFETN